jgi:hypothetical protein
LSSKGCGINVQSNIPYLSSKTRCLAEQSRPVS